MAEKSGNGSSFWGPVIGLLIGLWIWKFVEDTWDITWFSDDCKKWAERVCYQTSVPENFRQCVQDSKTIAEKNRAQRGAAKR
jgi:hypothetical protein